MTEPRTLPDYSADYGARTTTPTERKSLLMMDLKELTEYLNEKNKRS